MFPGLKALIGRKGNLVSGLARCTKMSLKTLTASFSNLDFSPKLQGLINAVNSKGEGEFHVAAAFEVSVEYAAGRCTL